MTSTFESEKNRKALIYTVMICGGLLLLFILISWKIVPPANPPVPELFEINLGNNNDGYGEEQPLIKGDRSPERENVPPQKAASVRAPEEDQAVKPEDNAEETAAPVVKAEKKIPNVKTPVTPAPVATPVVPKPQKPKIVYNGPGKGNGNGATQDNGYTMQGNTKGGKGDNGVPEGDKDSYGNTPGGAHGGPKVISGNRKVVRYYSFTGDLPKATINAIIKVNPAGVGTFSGFGKGSTATGNAYASAIANYLRNMQFDKAADESVVTVQFNFNVQ